VQVSGVDIHHSFVACNGQALVLVASTSPGDVALRLAAALGEREADAEPIRTVVLRLRKRDDSAWAEAALEWLAAHGRRALVRTRVPLSSGVVEVARRLGTTVLLELGHAEPARQVALVGEGAATVSSLLLHAQYLRESGLEVAAELGPLMPVVHERDHDVVTLVRHVAAADIRDAHLSVGRLSAARYTALTGCLSSAEARALLLAYNVDPRLDDPTSALVRPRRLPAVAHAALYHRVRRFADDAGLRIDGCGCPAQCHLDPELTRAYVPILAGDLFADAS
jgi:hypothetical protein